MKAIDYKKFESLINSAIIEYKSNIKQEKSNKFPNKNLISNLEGFMNGLNFIKQEVDKYAIIKENKNDFDIMKTFKEFLNEQSYKKIGPDQTGINIQYNVPNYTDDKQIILNLTSGKVDSKNNSIISIWFNEADQNGFLLDKKLAKTFAEDILKFLENKE